MGKRPGKARKPIKRATAPGWADLVQAVNFADRRQVAGLISVLKIAAKDWGEDVSQFDVDALAERVVRIEQWAVREDKGGPFAPNGVFDPAFPPGPKRLRKHAEIIDQLMTRKRSDSKRKGACPNAGVRNQNTLVVVTGPPASGKSWYAERIAEANHALIVDPDDVMALLPEYRHGVNAPLLHKESSWIAKGYRQGAANSMLRCAVDRGTNIVLPTVGESATALSELLESVRSSTPYRVYLLNVWCPCEVAALRSLLRTGGDDRYVPLREILGAMGDRPKTAYRRAVRDTRWSGYAQVSTLRADKHHPVRENHKFVAGI